MGFLLLLLGNETGCGETPNANAFHATGLFPVCFAASRNRSRASQRAPIRNISADAP